MLACSFLGNLYERGSGVTKDESRAVSLYRQGCDGGDDYGCKMLKELRSK